MKFKIMLCIFALPLLVHAQFSLTGINWPTPVGGDLDSGKRLGFSNFAGGNIAYGPGTESWAVTDINGDGKPDLVVTSEIGGAFDFYQFGAGSTPYWKVYLNTANGFADTAVNWTTPLGGGLIGGSQTGFPTLSGGNVYTDVLSETWSFKDMNGDGKPDIVVTGQLSQFGVNRNFVEFNAGTTPYWKVYLNNGNGFSSTFINWTTPVGGYLDSGNRFGYANISGGNNTYDAHSEIWSLTDINGDGKPDLVVTAELTIINSHTYGLQFNGGTPYWKVYLNTDSGFASTAINWPTPVGGNLDSSIRFGYADISGGNDINYDTTSETWAVTDINGDGKPDLVVTAALTTIGGNTDNVQFNANTAPYWKVFLNTGTGFSSTSTNWPTPIGGNLDIGNRFGYSNLSGGNNNYDTASEAWSVSDVNGDGKPDLVVTAAVASVAGIKDIIQFNASSNPYWKVYLNTTNGFSASATNWYTPTGGTLIGGNQLGYTNLSGDTSISNDANSETWTVTDIDGDGKPDLVVTAAVSNIANTKYFTEFNAANNPYWKVYLNDAPWPTGITEQQPDMQARLYPNPNNGNFTVQFSDNTPRSVYVTDITGRVVVATQQVTMHKEFDCSALSAGVYLMTIKDESGIKTLNIVVTK